jgi:DNA-binding MarR family transcriptional regulator
MDHNTKGADQPVTDATPDGRIDPVQMAHELIEQERQRMQVADAKFFDDLLDPNSPVRAWQGKTSNRDRRIREWAVTHSDESAAMKVLLRIILLHEKKSVGLDADGCWASMRTLSREASLSPHTVLRLLRIAKQKGLIREERLDGRLHRWVELEPTREQRRDLLRMWNRRWRIGEGRVPPREDALWLLCCPGALFRNTDPRVLALRDRLRQDPQWVSREGVCRFIWRYELVTNPTLGQPKRWGRRQPAAALKAVALTVELDMNSKGYPFRWTSVPEIAARSRYGKDVVRQALAELERLGWWHVVHWRGCRGGLLVWLALPPEVAERVRMEDALRDHLRGGYEGPEEDPDDADA